MSKIENNECWLLKIAYSWGDEEPDQEFDTFAEAYNEAKELAINEALLSSREHGCSNEILYEENENIDEVTIVLHYVYDDEYCRYTVCRW